MAPYSLPKEDVKWPPALQPPVGIGPPVSDPSLLVPPHGTSADFGQLPPEVLEPEPLGNSLSAVGEQLLPDLLISPHMLPCKDLGGLGGLAG
jgi:interferon regulatory factor 5